MGMIDQQQASRVTLTIRAFGPDGEHVKTVRGELAHGVFSFALKEEGTLHTVTAGRDGDRVADTAKLLDRLREDGLRADLREALQVLAYHGIPGLLAWRDERVASEQARDAAADVNDTLSELLDEGMRSKMAGGTVNLRDSLNRLTEILEDVRRSTEEDMQRGARAEGGEAPSPDGAGSDPLRDPADRL